jgi:DNA-binding GntR family transcriptional regulator
MADGLSYVPFKPGPGLVEHIALHIEHQIVAGILRSGDRIQETRVVNQLDVSRGSVRESFRVLERRRLIDVIPRRGAIVTSLSPSRVQDLTSALPVLLAHVVSELVPVWSPKHSRSLEEAMQASESKFGCINPVSVLDAICRLHPNTVYRELIDDLIPTFDRVFSKLVRLNLSGVESLDRMLKTKLITAIEAGQIDESVHQVSELCRSLERKYLETLERTG